MESAPLLLASLAGFCLVVGAASTQAQTPTPADVTSEVDGWSNSATIINRVILCSTDGCTEQEPARSCPACVLYPNADPGAASSFYCPAQPAPMPCPVCPDPVTCPPPPEPCPPVDTCPEDVNKNGSVDVQDIAIVQEAFGKTCAELHPSGSAWIKGHDQMVRSGVNYCEPDASRCYLPLLVGNP